MAVNTFPVVCDVQNPYKCSYRTLFYQRTKITKAVTSQPAFTCSKLTIETLEQGVKYVQS